MNSYYINNMNENLNYYVSGFIAAWLFRDNTAINLYFDGRCGISEENMKRTERIVSLANLTWKKVSRAEFVSFAIKNVRMWL